LQKFPNLRRDPSYPLSQVVGLTFRWPDHVRALWD
jgi:hypothetical protein